MKKKLDNYIIDTITRTSKFKILFILSIFLAFFGAYGLGANNKDFFGTILISFSSGYFNLGFLLLLFLNTIHFCSWFSHYDSYIIRLKDKKDYLKQMIRQGLKLNLIWIFSFFFIYLIILSFTNFGYFQGNKIFSYEISSYIYVIFYLLRYFGFACLLSFFIICFYVFLGERKTMILSFIFFIGYILTLFLDVDFSKNNFKILFYSYYMLYDYGSFSLEIFYSVLYLLLLECFLYFLIYMFMKKKSNFVSYIIRQDGNFIFNNRKIYLLLFLFLPSIFMIVNLFSNVTGIDLYLYSLGLKVDFDQFDFLQYIIYYYNILIYLLMGLSIFLKDYKGNLEYLFLRHDFKEFYLQKNASFLFYHFILMISQYIFLFIISLFSGRVFFSFDLLFLFVFEYLFLLLLEQIILFGYFIACILSKLKVIIGMVAILLIFILPKDIFSINILFFLFMICFMIGVNTFIHKKYYRKIIQVMGGV